jgi:hypothetical protein
MAFHRHRFMTALVAAGLASLAASACDGRPPDAQQASPAAPGAIALHDDARDAGAEVRQLAREVARLRHEVADLRGELAQARAGADVERPAPARDPRHDPQARADAERADAERTAAIESAFRGEPVDAAWRSSTEPRVRAALATGDAPLGEGLLGLECRSQTCRVEIASDDPAATARALPRMLMRLASTLPRATGGRVERQDGRPATVLYLSR